MSRPTTRRTIDKKRAAPSTPPSFPAFSERHGYTPVKSMVQLETMDEPLRNSLWNIFSETFLTFSGSKLYMESRLTDHGKSELRQLWVGFFKRPLDHLSDPFHLKSERDWVREEFFALKWHGVYDFVEFVARNLGQELEFTRRCNTVLERERSAYRFVDGYLAPISSNTEILSIEEAQSTPFSSVNEHIQQALLLMSDREQPDYRNSIKESISAVEAMARSITGSPKATLGKALNILEEGTQLHPALKSAFSSLYGYTCDADGIRHSLLEESNLGLEDAKFMLVACSAFVNYVIARHSRREVP